MLSKFSATLENLPQIFCLALAFVVSCVAVVAVVVVVVFLFFFMVVVVGLIILVARVQEKKRLRSLIENRPCTQRRWFCIIVL